MKSFPYPLFFALLPSVLFMHAAEQKQSHTADLRVYIAIRTASNAYHFGLISAHANPKVDTTSHTCTIVPTSPAVPYPSIIVHDQAYPAHEVSRIFQELQEQARAPLACNE